MQIKRHPILDWPIVTAENCFETVRELGIFPWKELRSPLPFDEYRYRVLEDGEINGRYREFFRKDLTESEKEKIRSVEETLRAKILFKRDLSEDEEKDLRFAPKVEVVFHENPRDGRTFRGFRVTNKPAAIVFAMIENKYVAITAEWKHGNNKVTLVPVAGVPGKAEANAKSVVEAMQMVALREYKEETGLELDYAKLLSSENGIYCAVRGNEIRFFPFLGHVKRPIVKGPTKFDENEQLAMLLFPIGEWARLIRPLGRYLWDMNPEFGLEACAIDAAVHALDAMCILNHYF